MEASILENVTNAAVWGSLSASFFLGTFLLVQAFSNKEYRSRYILFAAVNYAVAANDYCHPHMSFYTYEKIRIILWSSYAASLLWLLRYSVFWCLIWGGIFLSAATGVWLLVKPELGTSMVVGPAGYLAAVAHGQDFRERRCYASCLLSGCSLALGLLSTFYYFFLLSGDQSLIVTGYFHYAALSVIAVLFGWMHFPRELSGRAPVRIGWRTAALYVGSMGAAQIGVLVSLLVVKPWSLIGYTICSLTQIGATLLIFFKHRNELVIYTENVTVLLNERTDSLVHAQAQLASINAEQADRLARQAREIYGQNEVIERQRRLELAGQTAGQIAHDIKNFLSPIQLQLALLERNSGNPPTPEQIQIIKRQFARLRELTDQLLVLSRRGVIKTSPVLLNDLLRDVSIDASTGKIRIEWEGEAWALANSSQLMRAVANLVANAVDATNTASAEVTLACGLTVIKNERRCHMGYLKPGQYSFIKVADKGPGIPAEILDRIFEPFFSSKRTTESSGSGLGLSIVAAVIKDHNGILDLETSDLGTTFTIYLPNCNAPLQTAVAHHARKDSLILVVDDDPLVREHCTSLLQRCGYLTLTATSVEEALRCIAITEPHLVLLDLHLPDGSGIDVIDALKMIKGAPAVLVFSSYLTSDECRRISELGAHRFAYKPLGPSALLSAVEEALADSYMFSKRSQDVSNS